jgi:hypothetical protein
MPSFYGMNSHDNTIAQLGIGNYEFTAIHDLPTGALFVDDKLGLVRYDFQSKSIKPIGNKGQLSYSRSLFFHNVTRGVLVADENGLFLYDPLRDEIEPVAGGTNHGWVVGSYDVEDGVLVSFRNYDHASVYRYDPTKNSLTLVVDAPKAVARAKNNLDLNALNMIKVAGGMLVAGGDGLFKYDSGAHVFRPLNSKIADAEFHKINGGGVLVVAVTSFYYDENQETVSPVQSDPGLTWDSNPPAGPWYIPTPIVELFKTQACCALRYRRPRSHPRRQPSLFNILLHAQFQARVTDSQ